MSSWVPVPTWHAKEREDPATRCQEPHHVTHFLLSAGGSPWWVLLGGPVVLRHLVLRHLEEQDGHESDSPSGPSGTILSPLVPTAAKGLFFIILAGGGTRKEIEVTHGSYMTSGSHGSWAWDLSSCSCKPEALPNPRRVTVKNLLILLWVPASRAAFGFPVPASPYLFWPALETKENPKGIQVQGLVPGFAWSPNL